MLQLPARARIWLCALAVLAASCAAAGITACSAEDAPTITPEANLPAAPTADQTTADINSGQIVRLDQPLPSDDPPYADYDNGWRWQWLPAGLIYHSYMAGPQEPRAGIFCFSDPGDGTFGDATLGGRMGFLQYGNGDPVHPAGFQLDFYGAAIARLDLESHEDLASCDYVFGLPLTFGNERWQTKIGYAHLSSHLGDEFAIRNPGALDDRVNYVRDSVVWGQSYYPVPAWRVYGEVGWAIHCDGNAHRWTSQFGTELSRPGCCSSPFLAINGRFREDVDWVGDVNIQTGWLRRGLLGQTLRFGFDYYNGKSTQSQFFNNFEQQIGLGVWYDF
jgi:hypothetical protein